MRRLFLAFSLLLFPFGARGQMAMQYPTPLIYYRWWNDVQQCVGHYRDLNQVRFHVVDVPTWEKVLPVKPGSRETAVYRVGGEYRDSLTMAPGDSMFRSNVYVGIGWEGVKGLVRHEMAHAILRHVGNTHPDSIFKGRCAPLFDYSHALDDSTHN